MYSSNRNSWALYTISPKAPGGHVIATNQLLCTGTELHLDTPHYTQVLKQCRILLISFMQRSIKRITHLVSLAVLSTIPYLLSLFSMEDKGCQAKGYKYEVRNKRVAAWSMKWSYIYTSSLIWDKRITRKKWLSVQHCQCNDFVTDTYPLNQDKRDIYCTVQYITSKSH